MPSWLSWLFDNLVHIKKYWKHTVSLAVLVAVGTWYAANLLFKTQISNLQSEVTLLKSQLAAEDSSVRPLPMYSLGGSNILIYDNPDWATQDTAKEVELNWNRLTDVEAYALLRMRTEGVTTSNWVQARIVNKTNSEVVGTTERHSGDMISVRLQLPRATGSKIYYMQVRGQDAGLEGDIELLRITP